MTDLSPSPAAPLHEGDLATVPPAAEPAPPTRSAVTFDVLPLSREVRETLAEMGYLHPTPVQIAVWEPATRGKDAVVQARTGTGKTAAFGLPIVDHLVRRSVPQVQVLVLCPTRELAIQVSGEIERLAKKKQVKICAIYGGAPMQRQIDQIADGAQVVVGTPGRVLDHLRRRTLDPKHVRLLVLDESDEMLSMGFEREVTAILDALPKERQTLLFSATVPPDIERMAKKLHAPEYLTLSGDHIGALEIEHFVYMVASDKVGALVRVLDIENPESAVIFCNTKDDTERVAQAIARQGFDADWLNGDLPQADREKVMSATRGGRLRFLVATDVAARGIDISHLTHVINYDFPQDAESYIHRTGRTGRAGRTGTAVSLIMPQDVGGLYLLRLTYKIRPIEKQIPTEGEVKTRAEADLVAMLAEAFTSQGVHPDDLSLARRLLTHEQCDVILAGLVRDHLGARPNAQKDAAGARRATRVAPPPPPPRALRPPPAPRIEAAPRPVPVPVPAPAPAPAAKPVVDLPSPAVRPVPAPAAKPAVAEAVAPVAPAKEETPAAPVKEEAHATQTIAAVEAKPPRPAEEGQASITAPSQRAARPADDDRRGRGEPRPQDDRGRGDRRGPRGGEGRGAPGPRLRSQAAPPVSAAAGSREGVAGAPQRHADFSTWQPPEEEGDDEPIFGADAGPAAGLRPAFGAAPYPTRPPRNEGRPPAEAPRARPAPQAAEEAPLQGGPAAGPPVDDADLAEVYVNVGRRDGARASDFQRVLNERAGIDRANVRRIRVRERNAFVSVRREDLARALAALTGATIAGKTAMAEQARERSEGPAEGGSAAPEERPHEGGGEWPAAIPPPAATPASPPPSPPSPATAAVERSPDTSRGGDTETGSAEPTGDEEAPTGRSPSMSPAG
jgi:ATP-dependent RNA helicase DeaD